MRPLLPTKRVLLLALLLGLVPLVVQAQVPNAWINEIHYTNSGADADEFVEIVVENAGSVDLTELDVELYRDDGTRYGTIGDVDTDFTQQSTSGPFTIYTWTPSSLQNGPSDGLALCFNDSPLQVISYEGTFTGTEDCANGETSTDIGVSEDGTNASTTSLQLEGSGASYGDFTWTGPITNTKGSVNTGQTLSSSATITVDDDGAADHSSIQDAINAANAGDVIAVAEGTYVEDVTVNKDVTLEGPNAGTPGDGSRGNEATIEGQVVVSASGATFDGFDVSPPPATQNATGEALRISNTPDNVTVKNNVVRDFNGDNLPPWEGLDGIVAFGGSSTDAITNVTISNNKVQNLDGRDTQGGAAGISIQGNVDGADVTGNEVTAIGMEATTWAFGITVRGTGNHSETPSNVTVSNNDISSIQSNPSTPFKGVGFGFEAGDVSSSTVANNAFADTEWQIEDKTDNLDLDNVLADNTFDRAAVVRSNPIVVPVIFSSIQTAIDSSSSGQTVDVAAGTYEEQLNVTVDNLTITGASESGVQIVPPAVNRGVEIAADGVTFEKATIDASNVADYGIKAQGENPAQDASEDRANGLTLRNLTVGGAGRSEVDLNGVDNAVLEDLTLNGQNTAGNALALTDSDNITITDISSDGTNQWGGIALYAGSTFFSQGINNVTISGNTPSEGIYKQVKNGFDVTNLELPPAFQHTLRNSTFRGTPSSPADSEQFTFYVTDQTAAIQAALGLDNPDDSYVQTLARDGDDHVHPENNFIVGTSGGTAMSIQAALDAADPGATVNVQGGTYAEAITVDREQVLVQSVSGNGSSSAAGVSKAAPSGAPTINGQVILSANGVTFEGFVVSPPPATSNPTGEALLINNGADNVTVQNNTVQDFSENGLGEDVEGIVAFGGVSGNPLENVTITNNLVEDVTRTTDGGGAVGISIQGNVDGAQVTSNTVRDISKKTAPWGFGIVVRGSGNVSTPPSNVTVQNNTISTILSDPASPFAGVGFGFEGGDASTTTVSGNSLSTTELQAEDKTFSLDLNAFIANNTLDRAAVIRDGSGGVKDEQFAQRVYSTISAPVNQADAGETVEVFSGTYPENVLVDKSLTLQNGSTPVVQSFDVAASNVTINGFQITGGTTSAGSGFTVGIFVQSGTSGHTFSNNELTGPGAGGQVRGILTETGGVTNASISNNTISDWTSGIFLNPGASNLTITGNTFENNTAGIGSDGISNIAIESNFFTGNDEGFGVSSAGTGITVTNNCITDNSVGVQNYGGETVTATNNYWGHSSGPSGDFSGNGDPALGDLSPVDFSSIKVGACPGEPSANNDGTIAQAGNSEAECSAVAADASLSPLTPFAKYDGGGFASDLEGGGDDISFDPNPPTVPSGSWSSTTSIAAFLIKQGPQIFYWKNPGTALNYVSPNDDFSHMTFCIRKDAQQCDTPTLAGEDVVDPENRTVSNTIQDADGITEFRFTTLDNFTVVDNIPDGFSRSGELDQAGVTWTWTDSKNDPPTSVDFTLQAGPDGAATYFLEVTDACTTPKTTTFDPTHELEPAVTQARLAGNAPNPFSGRTTVEFALPEQTRVTLAVYDMMGRKVATLVDGNRPAGTHTITWNGQTDDGRSLASGVYLVRMKAGNQSSTRRLTIVR